MSVLLVVTLVAAGGASAEATTLCLPLKANGKVVGPTTVHGSTCKAGYEKIELPPAAELATLDKVLPDMKYEEAGVGGKPTVRFSGVNVQIVNGEGNTNTTNGEGNLVIGYDEDTGVGRGASQPGPQTGSHNLVLGMEQEFTSYGGVVTGFDNSITSANASVLGGAANVASGSGAIAIGGEDNAVKAAAAAIIAGSVNAVWNQDALISGGENNTVWSRLGSISGGYLNEIQPPSVLSWIAGGAENKITAGEKDSIAGGHEHKLSGVLEAAL